METLVEDKTLYTRCPTCSTAFKVTDELLALAKGKVRCGACLAIFQATDYMLERSKTPALKSAVASTPAPAASSPVQKHTMPEQTKSQAQPVTTPRTDPIASNQKIDKPVPSSIENADTDKVTIEKPIGRSTKTTSPQAESVADSLLTEDTKVDDIQPDQETISVEEFPEDIFSEELLDDDLSDTSELSEATKNQSSIETKPEPVEEIISEPKEDPIVSEQEQEFDHELGLSNFDDQPLTEEPSIDEDELSFHQIDESEEQLFDANEDNLDSTEELSDFEIDEAEIEESFEYSENELQENEYEEDELEGGEYEEDPIYYEEEVIESDDFEHDTGTFDELSDQLSEQMQETDYQPDPLDEFDEMVADNRSGIKSKLIIVSIFILLGIGLFSVWSNRQALAWSDTWGGTMKSICGFLPCELKAKRDVSKIKLLQRQLAPDEELENTLDVKVLLVNEATFAQPYPTIKIVFSNKDGEQVLVKGFKPSDYLEAESVNDLMPSESEVHIHFKTEVAGSDTLGFEFIFE